MGNRECVQGEGHAVGGKRGPDGLGASVLPRLAAFAEDTDHLPVVYYMPGERQELCTDGGSYAVIRVRARPPASQQVTSTGRQGRSRDIPHAAAHSWHGSTDHGACKAQEESRADAPPADNSAAQEQPGGMNLTEAGPCRSHRHSTCSRAGVEAYLAARDKGWPDSRATRPVRWGPASWAARLEGT